MIKDEHKSTRSTRITPRGQSDEILLYLVTQLTQLNRVIIRGASRGSPPKVSLQLMLISLQVGLVVTFNVATVTDLYPSPPTLIFYICAIGDP